MSPAVFIPLCKNFKLRIVGSSAKFQLDSLGTTGSRPAVIPAVSRLLGFFFVVVRLVCFFLHAIVTTCISRVCLLRILIL